MKTIIKRHDFSDFVFANFYPIFIFPTGILLWMAGFWEIFRHRQYLLSGEYFQFFYGTIYRLCFVVVLTIGLTALAVWIMYSLGSFRHSSQSEISYDDQSLEIKIRNSKRTYSWEEVRKVLASKDRIFICFKDNVNFHLSKKGISEEDWDGLLGVMTVRAKLDNHYLSFLNLFLLTAVVLWLLMKSIWPLDF